MTCKLPFRLLPIALIVQLTACGGGGGGGTSGGTSPNLSGGSNQAPVVTVGSLVNANGGETVALSASATDADGNPLFYQWTQKSGSRVLLDDAEAANPTFLAPAAGGTFTFQVTVSDGKATTTSSDVSVSVLPYSGDSVRFAQNPLVPNAPIPNADSVVISGQYAFVAAGSSGILVYDLSTPMPTQVGSYQDTAGGFRAGNMTLAGTRVVVEGGATDPANGTSMNVVRVLDISTPTAPKFVAQVNLGVLMLGGATLSNDGTKLYLTTDYGVYIYDLSTGTPNKLTLDTTTNPMLTKFTGALTLVETATQKLLYAAPAADFTVTNGMLNVFDVTDPAAIKTLSSIPLTNAFEDILVNGNTLYAVDSGTGLYIYDVTDPANPVQKSFLALNGGCASLHLHQNIIYATGWYAGVAAIDVSDPTNPTVVGSYATPGMAFESAWYNNNIYVTDSVGGLEVFDVTTPSFLQPIRSFGTTTNGHQVVARNGKAFLADSGSSGSGLVAYDVSNPRAPQILGTSPANLITPNGLAIHGNYAVIGGYNGLQIVNVANPAAMAITGTYQGYGSDINAVAVNGNYVYAGLENALWTFDITDKTNPLRIDTDALSLYYYTVEHIVLDGSVLHTVSSAGLVSADLSNPANPSFYNSGSNLVMGYGQDLAVTANRVVLSIGQDSATRAIGSYDTTSLPSVTSGGTYNFAANGLKMVGRHLYASEYFNTIPSPAGSLLVLDMADPANPSLAGSFALPDTGSYLDAADGYIFVATKTHGLAMMQAEPVLSARYDQEMVGSSLSYTVSWNEFPSSINPKVTCVVTGGQCSVTALDSTNRNATINWTLPPTAGDYEIAVAVGDTHSFFSTRDRVKAQ